MLSPPKQYGHVIWDWNGTLIDDVWLCLDILNRTLCTFKKPTVTKAQYIERLKYPVKQYYEELGFDFSKTPFEDIALDFNKKYDTDRHRCNLHQDVESILFRIASAGIKQSVLSAYQQHRLEESVKLFRIDHYFENIAGLEDCYAHSKLDRGRDLISDLDINHSEILLIGDTLHDNDVANKLEIDCILIANGHNSKKRLLDCKCVVLDSVSEIILYLI